MSNQEVKKQPAQTNRSLRMVEEEDEYMNIPIKLSSSKGKYRSAETPPRSKKCRNICAAFFLFIAIILAAASFTLNIFLMKEIQSLQNIRVTDGCKLGWQKYSSDEGCYYFQTESLLSWEDAQEDCYKMGADLVSIKDEDEDQFVKNNLKSSSWMGARYNQRNKEFAWSNSYSKVSYLLQKTNHVRNPRKRCLLFVSSRTSRTSYEWEEMSCDSKYNYVCKERTTPEWRAST